MVDYFTKLYARTDEKHEEAAFVAEVPEARRYQGRGIEVGHIFYFGTKYSEPLDARVATPASGETPVHMGSYGIGVSRLAGAIIEASHDEAGIIWPDSVAPYHVGLVNLKVDDAACTRACDDIYGKLQAAGVEVRYPLLDDRIVEFANALPPDDKVRGQKLRWFFKEALDDLLPQKIIRKSKHGFGLPFGPWCAEHRPLADLVGDSLADLGRRGWVRATYLERLRRELAGPHAGYYGSMVWVLAMLEQWLAARA